MPAENLNDLPVQFEMSGYVARGRQDWGDMTVAYETISGDAAGQDVSAIFRGLPDDRCQAEHWGYLLKGKMEYRFADRVETISAGQVYYIPPGHIPHSLEAVEGVEFTRTEALNETIAVTQRNAQELFGSGGES